MFYWIIALSICLPTSFLMGSEIEAPTHDLMIQTSPHHSNPPAPAPHVPEAVPPSPPAENNPAHAPLSTHHIESVNTHQKVQQTDTPSQLSLGIPWGSFGVVMALSAMAESGKSVSQATMGPIHFDLKWSSRINRDWDWNSMLGIYPNGTQMVPLLRYGYLSNRPFTASELRIGRQFIPFGLVSQWPNELTPYALAPMMASHYFAGGNMIADGVSWALNIMAPFLWSIQSGVWLTDLGVSPSNFGPSNQALQFRNILSFPISQSTQLSTSVHHMTSGGPTYRQQTDQIEWWGADAKLDWALSPHSSMSIMGEWVSMLQSTPAVAIRRSGGYATILWSMGVFDYGIRFDWLQKPMIPFEEASTSSVIFNIRHTHGGTLQLMGTYDHSGMGKHQIGASYIMCVGTPMGAVR